MNRLLTILIILCTFKNTSLALDTCVDCAKRKLNLCSEECATVPIERANDCQKLCVSQYCSHKCRADSSNAEIENLFNLGCEECKDQQFSLCNSNCDLKSEYKKAACQIDCAVKRCTEKCKKN
jgi:hypothetical protein